MAKRYDVVIVGGGASGCALAARLSENPEIAVLLIEAGSVPGAGDAPAKNPHPPGSLRSVGSGHELNWDYPTSLLKGRDWRVARGRALGGSMAINGGYFVRAHPGDFADWAAASGDDPHDSRWSYSNALPILRALETDLDYPDSNLHGETGPMQIARAWTQSPRDGASGPLDEAFLAAALSGGAVWEQDKNAGGTPGIGPVPMNSIQGVRLHPGVQYVAPARMRPNLEVRGNSHALRLRFQGQRVVGVDVRTVTGGSSAAGVETIACGEVVLAAGAIATPQLLLLSGIGPAEQLRRHGLQVRAELPGVGQGVSEHPDINLPLLVRPGVEQTDATTAFTLSWNFSASPRSASLPERQPRHRADLYPAERGDIELLLTSLPHSHLFGIETEVARHTYSLMIGLQRAESRGRISLRSNNPFTPPDIDYRFLTAEEDLARLRIGMRTAVNVLDAEPVRGLLADSARQDLGALVEDAETWSTWLRANIGLRFHTCGSARMGPESRADTVTNSVGMVHGVEGLRVADLSLLPSTPSRGPANTAVFIGEMIARAMS
ncbi:GMC family oxidoreductase N-terminal domain-containing protein [Nesterenkonia haasae]|uniref:GMC family oxidoreductase N-terminal domain-containing protein n=1 Tax=Nesterenkonia haasae TaxID=2587813 RepID=UPI001391A0DB|nr:GMC family oxidoreductase N-terminal domain-containing protein [Nesterenkonia haasae]NDK30212.1 FAD-dependent oxidoreductase [Nesterenkonia haasae]